MLSSLFYLAVNIQIYITGFDDEAYVEVYEDDSSNGMNYRANSPAIDRADDTPAIDRQDTVEPPLHIPGLSLPISVRFVYS